MVEGKQEVRKEENVTRCTASQITAYPTDFPVLSKTQNVIQSLPDVSLAVPVVAAALDDGSKHRKSGRER
jgi:hypothetical protein